MPDDSMSAFTIMMEHFPIANGELKIVEQHSEGLRQHSLLTPPQLSDSALHSILPGLNYLKYVLELNYT